MKRAQLFLTLPWRAGRSHMKLERVFLIVMTVVHPLPLVGCDRALLDRSRPGEAEAGVVETSEARSLVAESKASVMAAPDPTSLPATLPTTRLLRKRSEEGIGRAQSPCGFGDAARRSPLSSVAIRLSRRAMRPSRWLKASTSAASATAVVQRTMRSQSDGREFSCELAISASIASSNNRDRLVR
jgi:hypothetical protein